MKPDGALKSLNGWVTNNCIIIFLIFNVNRDGKHAKKIMMELFFGYRSWTILQVVVIVVCHRRNELRGKC